MQLSIKGSEELLEEAKAWLHLQNGYSDYTYESSGEYRNFVINDDEIAVAFRLAFDAYIGVRVDAEAEMIALLQDEIQKEMDEEILQALRGEFVLKPQSKVNAPNIEIIKTAVTNVAKRPLAMSISAKWPPGSI